MRGNTDRIEIERQRKLTRLLYFTTSLAIGMLGTYSMLNRSTKPLLPGPPPLAELVSIFATGAGMSFVLFSGMELRDPHRMGLGVGGMCGGLIASNTPYHAIFALGLITVAFFKTPLPTETITNGRSLAITLSYFVGAFMLFAGPILARLMGDADTTPQSEHDIPYTPAF